MDRELLDGIGEYFRLFQIGNIYVLPDDVEALLYYTGNPFKSRWSDDDEDGEDESYIEEFDVETQDHLGALYERLNDKIS